MKTISRGQLSLFTALAAAAQLTLLPAPAAAQSVPALEPIVVTATRYARPLEDLPARVTVVTAADLRRLSIEKLDEALAYVAGVNQSRQDGAYSFSAVVSLRGLSTAQQGRTLVLVDGVPVNTTATGGVNWNRIPIESVERIEVFKGPGSSVYGGDAVGGVVNIITRRPSRPVEAAATADVGSYQTNDQRLVVGGKGPAAAPGLYWRAYGYRGNSDGYVSTPESQRTAYTIKRYYEEYGESALGGFGWAGGLAEFEYSDSRDRRGEGTRILAPEGLSRTFELETYRASAEGKVADAQWRLRACRQQELYGRLNESGVPGATYLRVNTLVDRRDYNLSGSLTSPVILSQKLTVGGEVKAGGVNGADNYQTTPATSVVDAGKMETYAAYLQDDFTPGDGWPTVLASARYDTARFYEGLYTNPTNASWVPLSGPLPAQNWSALTWRASARQRIIEPLSAYLSYSRGFRQPNLEDMVLTLQKGNKVSEANPGLRPERVDTYEAGADYTPWSGIKLSPSVFYSRGKDFIYSVNTGATVNIGGNKPVYQSQNVTSVDIYGAEAEVSCTEGPATLSASYTYNHSRINSFDKNPGLVGNAWLRPLSMKPESPWAGAFLGSTPPLHGATRADSITMTPTPRPSAPIPPWPSKSRGGWEAAFRPPWAWRMRSTKDTRKARRTWPPAAPARPP